MLCMHPINHLIFNVRLQHMLFRYLSLLYLVYWCIKRDSHASVRWNQHFQYNYPRFECNNLSWLYTFLSDAIPQLTHINWLNVSLLTRCAFPFKLPSHWFCILTFQMNSQPHHIYHKKWKDVTTVPKQTNWACHGFICFFCLFFSILHILLTVYCTKLILS